VISRRSLLIGGGATAAGVGAAWYLWPGEDPAFSRALAEGRRRLTEWPDQRRARFGEMVRYATLAANSHNTQPWTFEVTGEALRIKLDVTRRCPVVDPEDRHLMASLGCAAENLAITARAAGMRSVFEFEAPSRAILVRFSDALSDSSALYDAIPKRQSTRAPFDPRPLPRAVLQALEDATRAPGVQARFLTSRGDLNTLKRLVVAGNTAQCNDTAFVDELLHWIRFNQTHAAETLDGLYAGSSDNPQLPRWLGRTLFPLVFRAETENPKYEAQLDGSAGAVILYAERDEPEGWFNVGRASQRFQLEATARDIRTSFVNQPIEVASVRTELTTWLGDGLRPALILRFGRGPTRPSSLRRPPSMVLTDA